MPDNDKVQGEPNGEVANATPATGVEAEIVATPSTQPSDAEKLAEIEVVRAKYEKDLNKMKSTFQSNEAKREQEWAARQAQYEQQMEQLKVSTMDEDQRKTYESTAAIRKLQDMENRLQEVENQKIEAQAMLNAQKWFADRGISLADLDTDNGYNALWESGMDKLTSELDQYRQQKTTKTPSQKPEIKAPEVVTQGNTPAYTGTTWSALVKEHGSEEQVYRLIETGQLPVSVLPQAAKQ